MAACFHNRRPRNSVVVMLVALGSTESERLFVPLYFALNPEWTWLMIVSWKCDDQVFPAVESRFCAWPRSNESNVCAQLPIPNNRIAPIQPKYFLIGRKNK